MAASPFDAVMADGSRLVWPPRIRGFDIDRNTCHPGGCAEVFPAAQRSMDRRMVCCKVLRPDYLKAARGADEGQATTVAKGAVASRVAAFVEEARITAALQSRYVPYVYRRGVARVAVIYPDGFKDEFPWPYFVMEWIAGRQLGQYLTAAGGPWAPTDPASGAAPRRFGWLSPAWQLRLLNLFGEIARGLRDAHRQGVAHLDVSHRNVLVVHDHQGKVLDVKIIDWGQARHIGPAPDAAAYRGPEGAGSPDYMAPEQLSAEAARALGVERVDSRADVYALGGIGYLLLTGKPPRRGTADEMREKALCPRHHEALYEELRQSGAPGFWANLIARCLGRAPADRPFETAAAVVDAIEQHRSEQDRRERDAERRAARYKWGALVAALLALLVASVFWVTDERRKRMGAEQKAEGERLWGALVAQKLNAEAEEKRQARLASRRFELHQALTAAYGYWYNGDREKAKGAAEEVLRRIDTLAGDNPDDCQSAVLRAYAYATVGEMYAPDNGASPLSIGLAFLPGRGPPDEATRRKLDEALAKYERSSEALQDLEKCWAESLERLRQRDDVRALHTKAETVKSSLLAQLGRFTESLQACDLAIALDPESPQSRGMRIWRQGLLFHASREQAALPWSQHPNPDHAKAVRLAAYLADSKGVPDDAVFNAACAHALAARASGTKEERDSLAERAVEYLERIRKKGYFATSAKRRMLRDDPQLASLRGRPDYERLCNEVEGK